MSITRRRSAKAERQVRVTFESSLPPQTVRLHAIQITQSRGSEMSTLLTNATVTPGSWVEVSNTTTGHLSMGGPFGRTQRAPIIDDYSDTKELASEAFNVPVERLIDLWTAKFGNEWVDMVDIATDGFFSGAYKRLKQLGELETHYLTDRSRYVCRKPT